MAFFLIYLLYIMKLKQLFCRHKTIDKIDVMSFKSKYIFTGSFPKGKLKLVYDVYEHIVCPKCNKKLSKKIKTYKKVNHGRLKYLNSRS